MFRKTVSLTALLSFLLLAATSVVLYLEPHGRVAYWAGWTIFGLNKTQWDNLHLGVGMLFLLTLALHVWLNWRPLCNALKTRAQKTAVFTPPFVLAAGFTAFTALAALFGWPPVRQALDLSVHIKDLQASVYGLPPFAHAELSSLEDFARIVGLAPQSAMTALTAAGVPEVAPERTLAALAASSGRTPQVLYDIMRRDSAATPFAALPAQPPPGLGRLALNDFARQFGLPLEELLERLHAAGVPAKPGDTLRDAARAAHLAPHALYTRLRTAGPAPQAPAVTSPPKRPLEPAR